MLHIHLQALPEAGDPVKPVGDAGEESDIPPVTAEGIPCEGYPLLPALDDHGIHVGQDAVHLLAPAESVGQTPEVLRRHAQTGDEAVVLHVLRTEGLVVVVQQGNDGSCALHMITSFGSGIRKRLQEGAGASPHGRVGQGPPQKGGS